jgi:two-component system, response regulator PdtaR
MSETASGELAAQFTPCRILGSKMLNVLVVENDSLVAMLLGQILEGLGHAVCATAATPAEAVDAARRFKPDLMIVDGALDGGSGVSAVEEILRVEPVPYLFLSGDPTSIRLQMPRAVVVSKPFREADLVRGIAGALDPHPPQERSAGARYGY